MKEVAALFTRDSHRSNLADRPPKLTDHLSAVNFFADQSPAASPVTIHDPSHSCQAWKSFPCYCSNPNARMPAISQMAERGSKLACVQPS